ncbi:hypothetical protein JTT00_11660 [Clostridium botulinum]|nr:hypothetical protein [Clostridium botulinum]MCS4466990.1 hypothetical protein [Clostridium botulinum]MCS4525759.1 hypothetical protein [Clostridium botulinum]
MAYLNTFNGFKSSSNKAQLEIKNNEQTLIDTKKQLTDKNLSIQDKKV